MTFYCTNCWNEIDAQTEICPYCGTDQNELDNESYVEKLIRSLNHPEASTPVRAANILGNLKAKEAEAALLAKLKFESDPFTTEAVVDALLKINPALKETIKKLIGTEIPITIKHLLED